MQLIPMSLIVNAKWWCGPTMDDFPSCQALRLPLELTRRKPLDDGKDACTELARGLRVTLVNVLKRMAKINLSLWGEPDLHRSKEAASVLRT